MAFASHWLFPKHRKAVSERFDRYFAMRLGNGDINHKIGMGFLDHLVEIGSGEFDGDAKLFGGGSRGSLSDVDPGDKIDIWICVEIFGPRLSHPTCSD